MNAHAPRLSIDTGLDVDLPPEDMSELDEITLQIHLASGRRIQRSRPPDTDSGIAGLAYRPPEPTDRLLIARGILLVVLVVFPGFVLTFILPLLAFMGFMSEHVWSQLFSFGFVIPPSLFLLAICYWRHFGPLSRRRHPPRLFPGLYLLAFFLYVSLLYGLYPVTNFKVIVSCGPVSSPNASQSPLSSLELYPSSVLIPHVVAPPPTKPTPSSMAVNAHVLSLHANSNTNTNTIAASLVSPQQHSAAAAASIMLSSTAAPMPSPQLCHALRCVSAAVSCCCLLCFVHLLFDLALARRVHMASRPRFSDVRAEFTSAGTFLCGCCCHAIAGAVWCFVLLGWALSPRRYKWSAAEREEAAVRLQRARADAEARVRHAMGIA